jgi:hypothetical protein
MNTHGTVERVFDLDVNTTGAYPEWPLIQASDDNFYGVTAGEIYGGVVFRIAQNGTLSVVYHQQIGLGPLNDTASGVIQATDGNLYGLALSGGAYGYGGIYQLRLDGVYSDVYDFPTFEEPRAVMTQHTNGKFYGTEYRSPAGNGSIYSFDMGLGPFITFVYPQGHMGREAQILGQGLTGTTSVTFSGVPTSSFHIVSDTYMTANIPVGATTGPVVVTTPTGALTSNQNFQIVP